MTKVSNCHDLPRANQSQAPEPRQSKQNAAHPHASKIPPGKAEHRERKSQEQETELQKFKDDAALYLKLTGQENTILDTKHLRRDNLTENESKIETESCKKWLLNARKKHLQAPFMYDMVEFLKGKEDTKMERKFTRTLHCRDTYQVTHDGQALTWRCENRWCNYCSSVRAAKLRDRYVKPLSELPEVWFVTLTGMAVMPGEGRLKERLGVYKKVWSKLIGKYKKRSERSGKPSKNRVQSSGNISRIRGLRKLEIEISKNAKTHGYFHPHFHVITQGTESFMREFISDWVSELSKHGIKASMKAQKAIRAQRDESGCIKMSELTKYVTKSLVEDPETRELKQVAPSAFAEIWEAVQGIRLIHPIDIKGELAEDDEEDGDSDMPTTTQAPKVPAGLYPWRGKDWIRHRYVKDDEYEKTPLTGYEPTETTYKHCAEMPEWLKEKQHLASIAISRSANKLLSKGVKVAFAVPENLPDPESPQDIKKEGEP